MNIFILDEDPVKAAQYLCDVHINKMMTEGVQMLCNALLELGLDSPTKGGHKHHRCSVWAKKNISNYQWLHDHTGEIINQYELRRVHFKKTKKGPHKSSLYYKDIPRSPKGMLKGELTPFAISVKEYPILDSVVETYRNYYREDKKHFAKWVLGEPYWWSIE